MRSWFILSAIGRDRPGLVSELARLIYDCDANLEDSRMSILGSDFAVMLLGSAKDAKGRDLIAARAKELERAHNLTIQMRPMDEGPRTAIPAPGTQLYRLAAVGEDRAGIVAGLCGILADRRLNVTELSTRSRPGPGGSPHFEMIVTLEVPEGLDVKSLRSELETEADRLVVDLSLMPA